MVDLTTRTGKAMQVAVREGSEFVMCGRLSSSFFTAPSLGPSGKAAFGANRYAVVVRLLSDPSEE
jgi:hypothetical protein